MQEDVMVFVNTIADIVHRAVKETPHFSRSALIDFWNPRIVTKLQYKRVAVKLGTVPHQRRASSSVLTSKVFAW